VRSSTSEEVAVARVRVHSFAVSMDGFGAGPTQSLEAPMGVGGERLHGWVFDTTYGRAMIGADGGTTGVDDAWLRRGDEGVGATLMGRNMFGPVRGAWPDDSWRGWWGEEPPYHHPVIVLTHHVREPLAMAGGTTFDFMSDGLDAGLARALELADGRDVRIGGGVSTVRECLRRGLVDSLHVALVPDLLRGGERLWDHLGDFPAGYRLAEREVGEGPVHLRFERA
jgi:dihydrofolate reductase